MGARRYSQEDQDRGLTALVITGNSARAADVTGLPVKTIQKWKERNPARFEQLRTELNPRVAERIASDAEHIAQELADAERELIAHLREKIPHLEPRDIANALRSTSVSKALQIDKLSSPLRERPSHVATGPQTIEQVVEAMAKLMGFDTTSTAVDVTEAPALPPARS